MAETRTTLTFFGILLLVAALSSFTLVSSEDASKSEEHTSDKDNSVSDDSSQDDSKEKRSQEEILFGNQQNRPSGLVDDLMGISDSDDDESESNKEDDKSKDIAQGKSSEHSSKEDSDAKKTNQEEESSEMVTGAGTDSWYNTVPVSSSALQYLSNPHSLRTLPTGEYASNLYDQEDLYRRKRQLLGHPIPLRKRRSLRSSLGQMIQKRGIRMPRRSMRLKRQVDMGDLLTLLGNDGYYEEQNQNFKVASVSKDFSSLKVASGHLQSPEGRLGIVFEVSHTAKVGDEGSKVSPRNLDRWENKLERRHVPGHFSSYPETPAPEFQYPFTFRHGDEGILSAANDFDDNKGDNLEGDNMDDVDNLMLLHPNARYVETQELPLFPYRTRDEENEAFQKWLARHATPNIFTVSRRSAPAFYPVDYRYMPGYKKRSSIFSNGNRMSNSFSGDSDDVDSDFGKWGHVVQVPDAYASAEDVARLYGLANLMAEGDEEGKMRISV